MPTLSSSKKITGVNLPRPEIRYLTTINNPNGYDTGELDLFGDVLCVTDDYIAASATNEKDANGTRSGKVYVFNINGGLIRTFNNPSGSTENDRFGSSIAISGDYIIIGTPGEDNNGTNNGCVYIFSIPTGLLYWRIDDPGGGTSSMYGSGDRFGNSVDASGDYIIVGAVGEQISSEAFGGAAYVFKISAKTQLHKITPHISGGSYSSGFGTCVAIDSKLGLFAISAPYVDTVSSDSGSVFIYNLQTGVPWSQSINGSAFGSSIGTSLSMCSKAIAVGTERSDDASQKVIMRQLTSSGWGGRAVDIKNPGSVNDGYQDFFAKTVSISDRLIVAGAHYEDESTTIVNSGKAYVFDIFSGSLIKTLHNPNPVGEATHDNFGSAVAISSNRICVSATSEDDTHQSSGKVYVYEIKHPKTNLPVVKRHYGEVGDVEEVYNSRITISSNNAKFGNRSLLATPTTGFGGRENAVNIPLRQNLRPPFTMEAWIYISTPFSSPSWASSPFLYLHSPEVDVANTNPLNSVRLQCFSSSDGITHSVQICSEQTYPMTLENWNDNQNGVIPINTWVHAALVMPNSSSFSVWINGVRKSTRNMTASFNNSLNTLTLNPFGTGAINNFIDEIRISNIDRYGNNATITLPTMEFISDVNTVALIKF